MSLHILYGVQGTGQGHISRARAMARALAAHAVRVTWLFSGRSLPTLFDMDSFGNFQHRRGLTFAVRGGRLDVAGTLACNRPVRFVRDVLQLDLGRYDLVVSDFEPITAWAGQLHRRPVIGLGHQYALGRDTPRHHRDWLGEWVLRHFAPVTHPLGLHWHPYAPAVLPPILDLPDQPPATAPSERHVLVYLPFEDQTAVTQWLQRMTGHRFLQYSPQLQTRSLGNVTHYRSNIAGFKQHLLGCAGVICNSGFELNSECLHLGKPVLTKPLAGQVEQLSNAASLASLGYARVIHSLDSEALQQWLEHPPRAPQLRFPDVAAALACWLAQGGREPTTALASQLWLQTQAARANAPAPGFPEVAQPDLPCIRPAYVRPATPRT